ncbi:MAG: hypothetical protein JRC92_02720 [Deltaproteobacteria bacterium]|nr:hypothetical protein [Deltaproteobacteria bacterium]
MAKLFQKALILVLATTALAGCHKASQTPASGPAVEPGPPRLEEPAPEPESALFVPPRGREKNAADLSAGEMEKGLWHHVAALETLELIASFYTGNEKNAVIILAANPELEPTDRLEAGSRIFIPARLILPGIRSQLRLETRRRPVPSSGQAPLIASPELVEEDLAPTKPAGQGKTEAPAQDEEIIQRRDKPSSKLKVH